MGLLDKFKKSAGDLKDQAGDLAAEHGDKAKDGMKKAGDFIDDKTGGKHSDRIDSAVETGHDAVDDLADDSDEKN